MKNSVTFVPTVRVSLLICCNAVLLLACDGANDITATGQTQTAALSYSIDSTTPGHS
jgi:hypothetical protein